MTYYCTRGNRPKGSDHSDGFRTPFRALMRLRRKGCQLAPSAVCACSGQYLDVGDSLGRCAKWTVPDTVSGRNLERQASREGVVTIRQERPSGVSGTCAAERYAEAGRK